MRLSPHQLNRATLARQMLLERKRLSVADGVRKVTAIQAQEPASPYLALWNRLDGFDPDHLDEAFAQQAIVKASLMRITLHAVHVDDYSSFHEAMVANLRASRLNDKRYRSVGLTAADADAVLDHVVDFASEARSGAEMEAMLAERLGATPEKRLWWALKTFARLAHAPTSPPWSFNRRPAYRAAPSDRDRPDRESALQHLVYRYLEAFGPASARDFGQFTLQSQADTKPALAALADRLVTYEDEAGRVLYDVPNASLPDADAPAPPRLMAMWDSTLLAYSDRSRILPPEHRSVVIRRNGDVLPTVLVDGYVAGVWRPVDGGIEVTAFHPLAAQDWAGLAQEASRLITLLADRDPTVYSRYHRWWSTIEGAEVRVVGG